MAPSAAEILAELTALGDASADALARLHEGDEQGVIEMLDRRERLVLLLEEMRAASTSLADDSAALLEAAQRAQVLDAEIVTLLKARQSDVAHELERLARARQSLRSYGGSRPGSAIYVERLS